MSQQLLIYEPDAEFAARLKQALQALGSFSVTVKSNVKDACLHLIQEPQALAFVPLTKDDRRVRALRAVQADLRIVVMTPAVEYEVPTIYAGEVQGVLLKTHLETDLATVLHQALNQPFPLKGVGPNGDGGDGPAPDRAALEAIMQQAKISPLVHSTVFAQGNRLLAHWGELNERQAATIVLRVAEEWEDVSPAIRIQFIYLPARPGDMLLYTRRVYERYQLTLAALPESPLTILRIQSDALISGLLEIVTGRPNTDMPELEPDGTGTDDRISYVIIWRAAQPMPSSYNIPLRQSFERLANSNGCLLKEVIVQPELVHIVMNCPAQRDAHWATRLLKNGSEASIREEFDLENGLWEPGYYTIESSELLSEAEVSIFLDKDSPEESRMPDK